MNMEVVDIMKEPSPKSWSESYKSRGLYGGILKILEGLLREKAEVFPEQPMICSLEEAEKGLEQQRKILLETMRIDNLEFEEIDFNDLKFLDWNEVHNQMYSDIKQEIVIEALRVMHLSPEEESDTRGDDLSTSVTDEFVSLLAEAYKDNPDFHFIPSMTFNQILQSCGEHLTSTGKEDNPKWKKIFASVYHGKHFYGCIAHVKEEKFYIVDSCRVVTLDSYRSSVVVLLVYMVRKLKLSRGNWTVHIVKNYSERHFNRNCGVFMCKCFQYWARGERLPLDEKNIIAARLILLYEVKKQKLADERMWESKQPQCVARGSSEGLHKKMESSSSSNTPSEVESRKLQPEWLDRFFKRIFFDPCPDHAVRRNELNKYCIDCDAPLCQHCLSADSHEDHRLLKIYRHVYKDVVPFDEIEQHIDISQIQPYRCNKQLVIALTPLPHSGGKTTDEAACHTCRRKLIEFNIHSYCSISCKVEAFTKKEYDDSPPFLVLDPLVQQRAKRVSELKKKKLEDQQMLKAKHASGLKKMAAEQLVQEAKHEAGLKRMAAAGQPVQKAKKEAEVKNTSPDQLVPKANQELELEMTVANQLEQMAKQEPEVNKNSRKRKGIPHRAPCA